MKKFLLLAAVAAIPVISSASAATRSSGEPTQVVSFADLDLGTERGARTLERRIAVAAEALCGSVSDMDPEGRNIIRRCRQAVKARASAERVRATAPAAGTERGQIRLTLKRP